MGDHIVGAVYLFCESLNLNPIHSQITVHIESAQESNVCNDSLIFIDPISQAIPAILIPIPPSHSRIPPRSKNESSK